MKKSIYLFGSILAFTPLVASANLLPDDAPFVTKALVTGIFIFIPLIFNAFIESFAGLIFILSTKKSYKILLYQFIANVLTFIPFFFIMEKFDFNQNYLVLTSAEIIIVIIEALIIKWLAKDKISSKHALLLSFIANTVSVATGIILSNL